MSLTTDRLSGLQLYNSMGRAVQEFSPVDPSLIRIFTSGPSVRGRPHIGEYRKSIFEDVLVNYLRFKGYTVRRSMSIKDVDHGSMGVAHGQKGDLHSFARRNEVQLMEDLGRLGIDMPDRMPRSSRSAKRALDIIKVLLRKGVAYRHDGDIFFDPLRFPGFGRLYGIDMGSWPRVRRRFRKDTYDHGRWNKGDFIIWHGGIEQDGAFNDGELGIGLPSTIVLDTAMAIDTLGGSVDIWCGDDTDLVMRHDHNIAVAESYTGLELARFWLHVGHILIDGKRMSGEKGNVVRPRDLVSRGLTWNALRFCLLDHPWHEPLDLTPSLIKDGSARLARIVGSIADLKASGKGSQEAEELISGLVAHFTERMDDDLDVKGAMKGLGSTLEDLQATPISSLQKGSLVGSLKSLDSFLKVLFQGER